MNLSIEASIPLIIFIGLFSATIASMIGLGGGVIAVPLIMLVIGDHSLEAKLISYVSIATLAIFAGYKYFFKENRVPNFKVAALISVTLIPTTIICELFLSPMLAKDSVKPYFHLMYAVVVVLVITLINIKDRIKVNLENWALPIAGLFIGLLSGTLGLSGGVMFIPLLVIGLNMKLKDAAVTSLLLKFGAASANIIVGGVSGQFSDFESNNVYWFLPLTILIGSIIGSQLGVFFHKKISDKNMLILFNCIMSILFCWEIISFALSLTGIR